MAPRIRTLRPRLATLDTRTGTRLGPATSRTSALRLGGRALQRRNSRILALYPLCPICEARGFVTQSAEVDHRLPLIDGGTDDDSNCWALCTPCHIAKTSQEAARRARGLPMPLPDLPPMKPHEPRYAIA
jgi:5-methylcytosine-specific restriction endonuclease McrA